MVTVVPAFLLMFFAPSRGWALIVGLSIPLAIAVGVLRYRMLDIVLRPVIVYGGLTAVVVAVFVAVSALAGSRTGAWPTARCDRGRRWSRWV